MTNQTKPLMTTAKPHVLLGICRRRFAFVSLDACMGSQLVTMHVLRQLQVTPRPGLRRSSAYGVLHVCASGLLCGAVGVVVWLCAHPRTSTRTQRSCSLSTCFHSITLMCRTCPICNPTPEQILLPCLTLTLTLTALLTLTLSPSC